MTSSRLAPRNRAVAASSRAAVRTGDVERIHDPVDRRVGELDVGLRRAREMRADVGPCRRHQRGGGAASGRATASRSSLSNCSIPHSCAAAISSITAGPESFERRQGDAVGGGEIADRADRRVAGHQHVGPLGDRADRPDFRRRAGRPRRRRSGTAPVGEHEIGLAGGERRRAPRPDPACSTFTLSPPEPHRLGGALDQVLVFHDE